MDLRVRKQKVCTLCHSARAESGGVGDRQSFGRKKIQKTSEEHSMTRTMLVIALALTLNGVLGSAFADDTPCNNQLLSGNYGFTVEGTKLAGLGPVGLQKGVAMAEFFGDGSFTQVDTVVIDGIMVADFTHTPANGSYNVNADCTGTFTIVFTDGRLPVPSPSLSSITARRLIR